MRFFIIAFISLILSIDTFAQSSYTCPDCDGEGKTIRKCNECHNGAIYCTTCDYRGVVNNHCYSCSGRGVTTTTKQKVCDYCNGSRYTRMEKQTPCSCRGGKRPMTRNGATVYVDCSRCSGVGYLTSYYNAGCRYCGARGYSGTENVNMTCSTCNGKGSTTKTCTVCDGKGAYVCSRCRGYANLTEKCTRCNGWGKIYSHN